ncbi:hypothetical protein OV320_7821 [Actinobacteria bacterium OV320]|jgi:hypothetical protein|nr:hypothetical protein OV320_7821 [Actinobacteria bacterium OV320]
MQNLTIPGEPIDRSQLDPTWNLMSQAGRKFPVIVGRVEDREDIAYALRIEY